MRITVHYLAQLKHAAGVGAETVDVEEGCTLPLLIRQLAARHGDDFRRIVLDEQGGIQPSLLVFAGEDQIDGSRALRADETVTLLAPMAGG